MQPLSSGIAVNSPSIEADWDRASRFLADRTSSGHAKLRQVPHVEIHRTTFAQGHACGTWGRDMTTDWHVLSGNRTRHYFELAGSARMEKEDEREGLKERGTSPQSWRLKRRKNHAELTARLTWLALLLNTTHSLTCPHPSFTFHLPFICLHSLTTLCSTPSTAISVLALNMDPPSSWRRILSSF
jgi:hypothetical protein